MAINLLFCFFDALEFDLNFIKGVDDRIEFFLNVSDILVLTVVSTFFVALYLRGNYIRPTHVNGILGNVVVRLSNDLDILIRYS